MAVREDDDEEKVVPKQQDNGKLIMIIGVALIVISLALSAVSLITIMSMNSKLAAPEEALEEELAETGEISVMEIETFAFTESFIFIFNDEEAGKVNNVVVDISVGVHNTADDYDLVMENLSSKESILLDGLEDLVKVKTYSDFKTPDSMEVVKNEILLYLQKKLETEAIIDVYFNGLLTTTKDLK